MKKFFSMMIILSIILVSVPVNASSTSNVNHQSRNSIHVVYFPPTDDLNNNDDDDDDDDFIGGNSMAIAGYQDWDFYDLSVPAPLLLDEDCDTVTCYGVCDGNVVDSLVCNIRDWGGGNFSTALPFDADGSYTAFDCAIPNGRYKIYVTGDADILKTYVLIVFSKFNTMFFSPSSETTEIADLPVALTARKFELEMIC